MSTIAVIPVADDTELLHDPEKEAVYAVFDSEMGTLRATTAFRANASYLPYPRGVRDGEAPAEVWEGFPALPADEANAVLERLAALIASTEGYELGFAIETLFDDNRSDSPLVARHYGDNPAGDFPSITAESTDDEVEAAVTAFVAEGAAHGWYWDESSVSDAVTAYRDELAAA